MRNHHTIISFCSLAGSLSAYYLAKQYEKDQTPFMLMGGFIGAMVGHAISNHISKDEPKLYTP